MYVDFSAFSRIADKVKCLAGAIQVEDPAIGGELPLPTPN